MAASACNSFRPNLWRPSTCANCYRPKLKHVLVRSASPQPTQGKYPAMGRETPAGRARSQSCRAAKGPGEGARQVGVVKPYAVVDLPADAMKGRKYSESCTVSGLTMEGQGRSRNGETYRANNSQKVAPEKGRRQTISGLVRRGSGVITPKRKAPPPPPPKEKMKVKKMPSPHPIRRNSAMKRSNGSTSIQSPVSPQSTCSPPQGAPEVMADRKNIDSNSSSPPPSSPTDPAQYGGRSTPAHVSHNGSSARTTTPSPQQRSRSMTMSAGGVSPSISPQHRGRSMTISPTVSPRPRVGSSTNHSPSTSPQHRTAAAGGSTSSSGKRTPPIKPPRTLSTFISTSEQDALLNQLLTGGASDTCSKQPLALPPTTTSGGAYHSSTFQLKSPSLPLERQLPAGRKSSPEHGYANVVAHSAGPRHERSSSSGSGSSVLSPTCTVFISPGQLHSQILQLLQETLQRVCEAREESLVCRSELWGVEWEDLCMQSEQTFSYKGIPLSLEVVTKDLDEGDQVDVELSQKLPPYLNLSLVRSILPAPPADTLPGLPQGSKYILRDCIDRRLLAQLLKDKQQSLSPEAYVEFVLFCLIQVLSAIKYIHCRGVCHRDVGLDSLYVTPCGSEWLVRLANFNYALHRPGLISPATLSFVYGYHELKWLGGADSRLPPEVMDTPEGTQSLDYSHTDCFAVGCIIHEVLGNGNPFELDPGLIYREYTPDDLPSLPPTSSLSPYLQRLTHLLLCRDPSERIGASTALLISQALLWLPTHWFRDPTSETLVRHHLSYEKAMLISSMAMGGTHPLPLSSLLKAQFLTSCDVSELLRALSLFPG